MHIFSDDFDPYSVEELQKLYGSFPKATADEVEVEPAGEDSWRAMTFRWRIKPTFWQRIKLIFGRSLPVVMTCDVRAPGMAISGLATSFGLHWGKADIRVPGKHPQKGL